MKAGVFCFFLIILGVTSHAQVCPTIQSLTINGKSSDTVCSSDIANITLTGLDLPTGGTIRWYSGSTPTFDPSTEGTYIDSSLIVSPNTGSCPSVCPDLLAVLINGCGGSVEEGNEYIIFTSGSGFKVDDLEVDLPNNFASDPTSGDINLSGIAPACGFRMPESTILTNAQNSVCSSTIMFAAGPGQSIPPDAIVILFTSVGVTVSYDFNSFCQSGKKVYILQSACDRSGGAFSNAAKCFEQQTTAVSIKNCPCNDPLVMERCGYANVDGEYAKDIGNVISSVSNGGVVVNSPPCSPPPYSNISKPNSSVSYQWNISSSLCGNNPIYLKGVVLAKNGCTQNIASPSAQITVLCPTIDILPIPTNYCGNDTLKIAIANPNSLFSYSYSASATSGTTVTKLSSSTNEIQYFFVNTNGAAASKVDITIQLKYKSCTISKVYTFDFGNTINLNLPDTLQNCSSTPVSISAPSGYDKYTWNNGNTTSSISTNISGIFIVEVEKGLCKGIDTTVVLFGTPIDYKETIVTPKCANTSDGSIALNIITGTPPYAINWNNGNTSNSITNLNSGTYTFKIVDFSGCRVEDTIILSSPKAITADIISKNPKCANGEDASIEILNIKNNNGAITTQLNDEAFINQQIYSQLTSGEYIITIKDTLNCAVQLKTTISDPDPLSISLPSQINIPIGESETLNPIITGNQGTTSYLWTPSDNLSCNLCQNPKITAVSNSAITLTAKDANGCIDTSTIFINTSIPHLIDIAAAFSPLGVNKNKYAYVIGNKYIKNVKIFKIYNRWGELVFESNNTLPNIAKNGWDGYYKGELQPIDSYIYYVEVLFEDATEKAQKGTIFLIK